VGSRDSTILRVLVEYISDGVSEVVRVAPTTRQVLLFKKDRSIDNFASTLPPRTDTTSPPTTICYDVPFQPLHICLLEKIMCVDSRSLRVTPIKPGARW
jgi:hypothetical protein